MTRTPTAILAFVGALGGLAVGPTVTLRPDSVDLPISPQDVLAHFRKRFADADNDIVADEGHRLVRRFAGRAGPFPYRTIELVTYETDAVTFEHLAGPFAVCEERFQLDSIESGTQLTHTGQFRLRGGLWTAPLALTGVRRAFEDHVHEHLEALRSSLSAAGTT